MDERLLQAENIVFDVGNVLLRFDPRAVCGLLPDEMREPFFRSLFENKNWGLGDTGLYPLPDIARKAAKEAGYPYDGAWVMYLYEHFHEVMYPLPLYGMIPELHAMGKRLFGLTNYPQPSFSYARRAFPLLNELDGIVVSSDEKLTKPDRAIFLLAQKRFGLDPEKTLFIDDTQSNAEGALNAGWHAWHYILPVQDA